MKGLITSVLPVFEQIAKKYFIESILLSLATIITIVSFWLLMYSSRYANEKSSLTDSVQLKTDNLYKSTIMIDIGGAVIAPDVYEISSGARLKDVLIMAGGLSADADRVFFSKNFNLARIVNDQEKIYIPSLSETNAELSAISTIYNNQLQPTPQAGNIINLNTASIDQLDQLPGIGKVTAEKIIRNRPYTTVDQLLEKKVVSKSVFEKIKSDITVY